MGQVPLIPKTASLVVPKSQPKFQIMVCLKWHFFQPTITSLFKTMLHCGHRSNCTAAGAGPLWNFLSHGF